MKKTFAAFFVLVAAALVWAQQSDILVILRGGKAPVIAIADIRGAGAAQQYMGAFNTTLYDEIANSGSLDIAAKSMYPLRVPQRPQDFVPGGASLEEWKRPPVNANYLAFGYTAEQNGQLVLFGYLFDTAQPNAQAAQVIGKLYFGPMSEDGARKVAREFAADILARFGAKTLAGSKIYFVSDRTGAKEIWEMDYDGANQKPVTSFKEISITPAVSANRLAFTRIGAANPSIIVYSLETKRRVPFVNPQASVNSSPDFAPDGNTILFSSSLGGGWANIFAANADGSNVRRLTSARAVETEPKVNPKSGTEVVFTSGRSGPPQLYRMSIDGTGIERLTTGEGEAVNPSWHPDGQFIAFAWTRGFELGNFNIFVMDVNKREYIQLTHGTGRNENPTWAPDGRHLVFASTRGRTTQIYTMLADGTQVKQLTASGNNRMPVWSR